jgi:hypothetical protein
LPAAVTVLLLGCGGGGGESAAPAPSVVVNPGAAWGVAQSNLEIATALYADNARIPADFYQEPLPQGQQVISTTHIKNVDVGAAGAPHEMCTDDFNQALAWSEAAATRATQYRPLVATDGNERYFEFDRVSSADPQLYQRGRIFHCSYVDRSSVDLQQPQGVAGSLNIRPLSASDLKLLSEYLWRFTTYNNFGHAVLRSNGDTVAGGMRHTLYVANLQSDGMAAGCDRVTVEAWAHTVDGGTGALSRSVSTLWSFGVRSSASGTQLCSS